MSVPNALDEMLARQSELLGIAAERMRAAERLARLVRELVTYPRSVGEIVVLVSDGVATEMLAEARTVLGEKP